MICRECGKKMLIDDKKTFFKGCVDKYWICKNCHSSCIEEIRFSQSFKEHWTIRYYNTLFRKYMLIKEYTIKHKIDTSVRIKRGDL